MAAKGSPANGRPVAARFFFLPNALDIVQLSKVTEGGKMAEGS